MINWCVGIYIFEVLIEKTIFILKGWKMGIINWAKNGNIVQKKICEEWFHDYLKDWNQWLVSFFNSQFNVLNYVLSSLVRFNEISKQLKLVYFDVWSRQCNFTKLSFFRILNPGSVVDHKCPARTKKNYFSYLTSI